MRFQAFHVAVDQQIAGDAWNCADDDVQTSRV